MLRSVASSLSRHVPRTLPLATRALSTSSKLAQLIVDSDPTLKGSLKSHYEYPQYPVDPTGAVEAAYDQKWVDFFDQPTLDAWELNYGYYHISGEDCCPKPEVVSSMLRACRRLNDFPRTVRIFELVYEKANWDREIYNWVLEGCKPTIEELGLSTPEELGVFLDRDRDDYE